MAGLFDFLRTVYGHFGFTFKMKLSTRPDKFLGEVETWDRAEKTLANALDDFCSQGGSSWEMNPGDGAFYGPKIDITISDALKRDFQCATIQLDFQLPQQFNLEFRTAEAVAASDKEAKDTKDAQASITNNGAHGAPTTVDQVMPADAKKDPSSTNASLAPPETDKHGRRPVTPGCARPVMIHRAIYGSFERFIAILTEHFAGKWPFWLSPRQILVMPIMPSANDYTLEVQALFRAKGFHVDVDISGNTIKKKILLGQQQQYNYIFVVGATEKENRTVNVRDRDDQSSQQRGVDVSLEEAMKKMEEMRASKALPVLGIQKEESESK